MNIEGKILANDEKALLIAEISANHDRDLDQALHLVDIAADCGWDCLKLQTYTADSLTLDSDHPAMSIDAVWGKRNLYELYKAASMPMSFHEPLFEKARARGLLPFTSVYDPCDIEFVEKLGCSIYKIASFELTYDDLLSGVGQTRKPIILSTGMATLDDIDHALEVLDKAGAPEVVLLHCCSSYPAPIDQINLNAMKSMGLRSGRLVGFSDHTIGARAPLAAVAMGAVAIEKHFTNDPSRSGPDHRFSATPEVMKEISQGVLDIHQAKGVGEKHTTEAEQVSKEKGRRSAFALKELSAGHTLSDKDYRFVRPCAGIPANSDIRLAGRVLKNSIAKGHPICAKDIII